MYKKEKNADYSRSLWGLWPLNKPKWQYLNPIERCFVVLCQHFQLHYDKEQLFEELPAHKNSLSFDDMRKILNADNCRTYNLTQNIKDVDERFFPIMVEMENNEWYLILKKDKNRFFSFNPNNCQYGWQTDISQYKRAYFFKKIHDTGEIEEAEGSILSTLLRIFKKLLPKLSILSILVNLSIIAMPLYIIMVYDRVVSTKAYETLLGLLIGMLLISVFDYGMRQWRSRVIIRFASLFDIHMDRAIIKKMADWPLQKIESMSIYQHYLRLKSYEGVRDAIVGPLFNLFIDIPFIIIAFAIIAFVGGWIALIPIAMTLIFIIVGTIKTLMLKPYFEKNNPGEQSIYDMILSSIRHRDLIQKRQLADRMQKLFGQLAAKQSVHIVRQQRHNMFIQHFGQFIMMSGGIITIGIGGPMARCRDLCPLVN